MRHCYRFPRHFLRKGSKTKGFSILHQSVYKRIIFYDAHNTCRTINLFSTYPELLGFKGTKGNIGTKGVPGDKGERGDVGWRGETGMQVQLKMWKICRNSE